MDVIVQKSFPQHLKLILGLKFSTYRKNEPLINPQPNHAPCYRHHCSHTLWQGFGMRQMRPMDTSLHQPGDNSGKGIRTGQSIYSECLFYKIGIWFNN